MNVDWTNHNLIGWFWGRTLFYIKARKLPSWPYRFRLLMPTFSNIKRCLIRNNPLPILLRNIRGNSGRIIIVSKWGYWLQYLEKIIQTDKRFVLYRSPQVISPKDSALSYNINDPDLLNVVIGGKEFFMSGNSREVFLTRWHRVFVRVQHSPGFGLTTFIQDYGWIKECGFKLMIPRKHWDCILKSDNFPDHILKLRQEIINDGAPLVFTHFDPKLNRVFNSPRIKERKPGTALISCNYRIGSDNVAIQRLLKAIEYLSKDFKITINLHPFVEGQPAMLKQSKAILLGALHSVGVEIVTIPDSVQEMVNLYDAHEFIVTDGSGSVYEAIARGCKALTLDGLSYQENKDELHPAVELGLLPKTLVWAYKRHPGHRADMEWLKELFPTSLVQEDITPKAAQEIVDVFNNWSK